MASAIRINPIQLRNQVYLSQHTLLVQNCTFNVEQNIILL